MTIDLEKKPYLIDAVIGNSRFLASLQRTGRMVRLWWPHVDMSQHVDTVRSGLRIASQEQTSWFDSEEDGWKHTSGYVPSTNIVSVTAQSETYPIRVETAQFAVPEQDIIVFNYKFTNTSEELLDFSFLFYGSFQIGEHAFYHTCEYVEDSLSYYRHREYVMVSGTSECTAYQSCDAWENANHGALDGNDINMKSDGAMQWRFSQVAPGATVSMPLYITAGHTRGESAAAMRLAKSKTAEDWTSETAAYWHNYLQQAKPCPIEDSAIAALYERSLLAIKLMADEATGSIIAAPEFDELFTRCGGYAFCWGRDAAFITTALDQAGLTAMSTKFYLWTLTAQEEDGSWLQRHYHDGSVAPNWGLQLDEGASILWGMFEHYKKLPPHEAEAFAKTLWPSVYKGAQYLIGCIDEETGVPQPSMDIWEERKGEHTYSSSAVYAGVKAAAQFAHIMKEFIIADKWNAVADGISNAIVNNCWNEEKGIFYRGLRLKVTKEVYDAALARGEDVELIHDSKGYPAYRLRYDTNVDVSLLGVSQPFGVLPSSHPYMKSTAAVIERELTSPEVGGIKRYEDDHYIGGNPWILTTLWLAQYRIANGQIAEAKELLQWATEHQTNMGLLPEQVDRTTGETAWVVPLTWSHAMYVLTVHMLAEAV